MAFQTLEKWLGCAGDITEAVSPNNIWLWDDTWKPNSIYTHRGNPCTQSWVSLPTVPNPCHHIMDHLSQAFASYAHVYRGCCWIILETVGYNILFIWIVKTPFVRSSESSGYGRVYSEGSKCYAFHLTAAISTLLLRPEPAGAGTRQAMAQAWGPKQEFHPPFTFS